MLCWLENMMFSKYLCTLQKKRIAGTKNDHSTRKHARYITRVTSLGLILCNKKPSKKVQNRICNEISQMIFILFPDFYTSQQQVSSGV
jgi:hypothetical protein